MTEREMPARKACDEEEDAKETIPISDSESDAEDDAAGGPSPASPERTPGVLVSSKTRASFPERHASASEELRELIPLPHTSQQPPSRTSVSRLLAHHLIYQERRREEQSMILTRKIIDCKDYIRQKFNVSTVRSNLQETTDGNNARNHVHITFELSFTLV